MGYRTLGRHAIIKKMADWNMGMPRVVAALLYMKGQSIHRQFMLAKASDGRYAVRCPECHECGGPNPVALEMVAADARMVLCEDCRKDYSGGGSGLAKAAINMLKSTQSKILRNMLRKESLRIGLPGDDGFDSGRTEA